MFRIVLATSVCALFVLSLATSVAQELEPVGHGPYVKAAGSFGPSLGYRIGVAVGGGFDHRWRRALLLTDATFDTADKVDAAGSSLKGGAGLYYMKQHLGGGGGARCVKLITTTYAKASCRPYIGGVFDTRSFRFDFAYLLPGTDRINRLHGLRTMAVFPFTRQVQFELETGAYRFRSSQGTRSYFGFVVNPGIRYKF